MRPSKRFLLGLLALQELSVCGDLLLQPSLDIHEDLVFGVLALHVSSELRQLCLDAANQPLDLCQLRPVTRFRVGQGAFQRCFLSGETTGRKGSCQCRTLCAEGNTGPFQWGVVRQCKFWRTMLSWDCSSISSPCRVRLRSVTSDLLLCSCSVLTATSRFSSSVWDREDTTWETVGDLRLSQYFSVCFNSCFFHGFFG